MRWSSGHEYMSKIRKPSLVILGLNHNVLLSTRYLGSLLEIEKPTSQLMTFIIFLEDLE